MVLKDIQILVSRCESKMQQILSLRVFYVGSLCNELPLISCKYLTLVICSWPSSGSALMLNTFCYVMLCCVVLCCVVLCCVVLCCVTLCCVTCLLLLLHLLSFYVTFAYSFCLWPPATCIFLASIFFVFSDN